MYNKVELCGVNTAELKASALGTTKKMHFVRTDTNYCDEEEEQK